jgi:hypothetical protein
VNTIFSDELQEMLVDATCRYTMFCLFSWVNGHHSHKFHVDTLIYVCVRARILNKLHMWRLIKVTILM